MTMEERFFLTGATGCIGAWVARNLVMEGVPVCASVRGTDMHRLELILSPEEMSAIDFRKGDITDLYFLEKAIGDSGANRIIHLAAMQLPFCKADPPKGAMANVLGTVNIFEAAKRAGLEQVVYSSSTAVYGTADEYPAGPLPHDAPLLPRSHYGVYKQANEWGARVYWSDDGIASIGLRPYVVYGPGRDQGMTSTPTKAMLAAALGRPYNITYGGKFALQYADDSALAFIQAARTPFKGAVVFNIGGASVTMPEVIEAITAACPESAGTITFENTPLPFPPEVDNGAMTGLLGEYREVPLRQGVRETIACFRVAIAAGRLGAENLK
jgi:UDP-glucuronate 4-epimerase